MNHEWDVILAVTRWLSDVSCYNDEDCGIEIEVKCGGRVYFSFDFLAEIYFGYMKWSVLMMRPGSKVNLLGKKWSMMIIRGAHIHLLLN